MPGIILPKVQNLICAENAAKCTKALKFHMYIVQPGVAKVNISRDILLPLGNMQHYPYTIADIDLKVYTS